MVSSCGQGREHLTWVIQEVSPLCGLMNPREKLIITHKRRGGWKRVRQGSRCQKAGAQRRVGSGTDDMLHRDAFPWVKERPGPIITPGGQTPPLPQLWIVPLHPMFHMHDQAAMHCSQSLLWSSRGYLSKLHCWVFASCRSPISTLADFPGALINP